MLRSFRTFAAVVAATLAFAAVAAAPAQAAVGQQFQQKLPSGQVVTMERVAEGVAKSVTEVAVAADNCSRHYLCMWNTDYQSGTMWTFFMNTVRATTTNGVAHCWNLGTASNNKAKSYYNMSDWDATIYNWVNCNANSEQFGLSHYVVNSSADSKDCLGVSPGNWCSTLFPTSIKAW
jgi:hypothetical protein